MSLEITVEQCILSDDWWDAARLQSVFTNKHWLLLHPFLWDGTASARASPGFFFGTKLAVTTCIGLVLKVLGTFDSIVNLLKCTVQAHMYMQNHPHTHTHAHTHTLIIWPMSQQERINRLLCVSIIVYLDNTLVQHLKVPFNAKVFFYFGCLLRKCERATHYFSITIAAIW